MTQGVKQMQNKKQETKHSEKHKLTSKTTFEFYIPLLSWSRLVEAPPKTLKLLTLHLIPTYPFSLPNLENWIWIFMQKPHLILTSFFFNSDFGSHSQFSRG